MLEFGVEVSTDELVALERALRGLGSDAARSALAKAHRTPVVLAPKEREAVLSALRIILEETPTRPAHGWKGLARLVIRLEREQEAEPDEPPQRERPRPTKR